MSQHRLLLEMLPDGALAQIEDTATRLLDEVGVSLDHRAGVEMLHGLGCRVGTDRVHIPPHVVQSALENIVPQRQLYNRDGSEAFSFGDGQLRFHSGGGLPFILDSRTGKQRNPTLEDVADATRLLDALPHVDVIIPLLGPQDVPPELMAITSTEVMLRNTTKPVWSAPVDTPEHVPYMVEMAAACCGGMEAFRQRPTMYLSVSPVSPLDFPEATVSSIIAVARSGAPLLSLPAPSLGATGPVTMAGGLAQQHAETLASYVIAAAARPGTPVIYCSRISAIDPRTAVSIWGGPDVGLTGAVAGQLAHRLGLPADTYGLSSSTDLLDPQFAYERLANAMIPALAGVDILSGVGSTRDVMIAGLEIAVIDNEIISLLKQIVAGCRVDQETLAYEMMKEVILRDGVFLAEMHTVRQMRRGALWIPEISTRGGADDDENVVQRAGERVHEILGSHTVEHLSDDAGRQLDDILDRARRNL